MIVQRFYTFKDANLAEKLKIWRKIFVKVGLRRVHAVRAASAFFSSGRFFGVSVQCALKQQATFAGIDY